MNKLLRLLLILCFSVLFCLTSCDQEHGDSGSSGGGGNSVVAITSFTVSPSGTINMTVDETKDFTITYEPANATVTNIFADLTYDMDYEFFYPVSIEYIKFNSTSHSITITVRAKKAGNTTISASLISNPSINGSVTFNISDNNSSSSSNDDSSSSSDSEDSNSSSSDSEDSNSSSSDSEDSNSSSSDGGDDSSSSSSSGDEGGTPTDITTLNVTVTCVDRTMDNIYYAEFYYDRGNYESKKAAGTVNWTKKNISHSKITVNKTDAKNGTVTFTVKDEGLGTGLRMYYYVRLVDEDDIAVGNLKEIYQDTRNIEEEMCYPLNLISDGVYGDAAVEMES